MRQMLGSIAIRMLSAGAPALAETSAFDRDAVASASPSRLTIRTRRGR